LYIKRACELNKSHIISTDEDPGLRIESFAVINLRGVSTNKTIISFLIVSQKEPARCRYEDMNITTAERLCLATVKKLAGKGRRNGNLAH
jgi:hypothetical protein